MVNFQPYIVENSKKEGIELKHYNAIMHTLSVALHDEENVEILMKRSLQMRLADDFVYRVTYSHRKVSDRNMYNDILGKVLIVSIFKSETKITDKQLQRVLLPGKNFTTKNSFKR